MARPLAGREEDYDDPDINVGDCVYFREMSTLDKGFAPVNMCVDGVWREADYDPPQMIGKRVVTPERWYETLTDVDIDLKKATGWAPLPKAPPNE